LLTHWAWLQNGILMAVMAHGMIGISLVWDKVLLGETRTRDVVNYVFWLGVISILGLLLIPFGFRWPGLRIAGLAVLTGILHMAAIYFYYSALQAGEASQTLAVMGGFSPVATMLIGLGLLPAPLGGWRLGGFALLAGGGFVMFLSEKLNLRKVLPGITAASGLFGLVNVLQKVVFDRTEFVTGYVLFTFGTFLGAALLLVRPAWRAEIFRGSQEAQPRARTLYFVNRFLSGVGSFLVFYAISLENPAVVDAISGVRYVIIFLGAYLVTQIKPGWLKEDFHGWTLAGKSAATALVVAGLVALGVA
jgi:drug/metabolite transporter (DMT)-like permease